VEVTLPSDFGRCLWVGGCFEPNETAFLASVLRPGMIFVDVGANIGLYTLLAAHLVAPGGTVVAVEPVRASRCRFAAISRPTGDLQSASAPRHSGEPTVPRLCM